MIDSYQPGDKLTNKDFIDDYYMPQGRYMYCEVVEVDDDNVKLLFVGDDGLEDEMTVSRDQMARMLGWEEDLQLGADDIQTEIIEKQIEMIEEGGDVDIDSPDESVGVVEDDEVESILSAPAEDVSDNAELIDTEGISDKSAWVEVFDGFATKLHLFATKSACLEDYHANAR